MRAFFKYVFATIVGLILFSIVSIVLFFVIISVLTPENVIKENSVLSLNLNKRIIERESGDLFAQFTRPFSTTEPGTMGLLELRQAIQSAAINENVKGIYLNVNNMNAGMATIEELRQELEKFKESGKFLVAYGDFYTENAYYLASVADKIYLPPSGTLEFNGLHIEVLFFKKLLDKLEIEPEVFKVGQYKSAVEPFITEEMSVANREQLNKMLNSTYSHILSQIGASRGIDPGKLRAMSDSMLVRNPEDALEFKLVTDLDYRNVAEEFVREQIGLEADEEINYVDYWSLINLETETLNGGQNRVAVIFASGDIRDGVGDERTIGSESLVDEIQKAREDSAVKAVVLRINSPGGSALASDVIWREVKLTSEVKPVIASMGDVAASGGYYIAAGCDSIVAQPTTITGSIGVFGVMFNGKQFLNNKLYITSDRAQTGPFSDIGSFTRPLRPEEERIIQNEIEEIYRKFLQVVANGRGVDTSYVNKVAQGRVWSGINAEENRLVDRTAGLDEAVEIAAGMANIEEYDAVYLPERPNLLFKQMLSNMSGPSSEEILQQELGDLYYYVKQVREIRKMEGVQARLPADIVIE